MLFDAGIPGDRQRFARTFDVCVVGAGPAGITLARRLASHGLYVALMEAGELDYSAQSQGLYAGDNVGLDSHPTDESRLRFFGGTSGHWDGKCRSLEREDFEQHAWLPLCGWPIRRADLEPYHAEAAGILDLESPGELDDLPLAQRETRFREIQWRWSAPTRFGDKYRDAVIAAPNIALCLRANLVDLRLADDFGALSGAVFRSYAPDDPGFTVRARAYALCLGGIENARALLGADSQVAGGIGNEHDLVGRYFCDRPTVRIASFAGAARIGERCYVPTRGFMEKQRITSFALNIEPRTNRAVSLPRAVANTLNCLTPGTHELAETILDRRVRCLFGGLGEFNLQYDPEDHPYAIIGIAMEQELNRASRVRLGEARDALGLRKVEVDWRLTECDYRTMRSAALAFGAHVAEQGEGRVRISDWLLADDPRMPGPNEGFGMVAGRQHMCTTRMSRSPKEGVVDGSCRVHSVRNLYVGGSSVFGSPGFAKPTFTIVQLSLRLGDHLGAELRA